MPRKSDVIKWSAEEIAVRRTIISDPALFIATYSSLSLEDFHVTVLRAMQKNRRIIILLPCTHGKTTLTAWYCIWRIAQNPNIRILLIAKNDDEAALYSRTIRTEFVTNYALIRDWGPFKPPGKDVLWSNDQFNVAKRQINDIRPTFTAIGSKSADRALGKRCDELIVDDIVGPETAFTPEQREKQLSIFNIGAQTGPRNMWPTMNGVLQVPDNIDWPMDEIYEGTKLLGTVFHPHDLFHAKGGRIDRVPNGIITTSKTDPTFKVLKFDCWRDDECMIPLWPSYVPAEVLRAEEKSLGLIDFNRRYRNIAIDEGSLIFRRIWAVGGEAGGVTYPGCLDPTLSYSDAFEKENKFVALGLDPSTGRKGKGTTKSGFVILGVDQKEDPMIRYVLHVSRAQFGPDDILSRLFRGDAQHGIEGLYEKFRYNEGRIEQNAAQKWLLDLDRAKKAALEGIILKGHETQGQKFDPIMGVSSLQSLFKNGWIRFPYREVEDKEITNEFLEEILMFPEGPGDTVMALWFAELAIRELGSKYTAWTYGEHSPGITMRNPFYSRT